MLNVRIPFCALVMSAALPALAANPSREISRTVPLPANGTLTIETYKGSVAISTWDKAEVQFKARIEAEGDCGDGREAVEKTVVNVESHPNEVHLESDYSAIPREWSWWGSCSSRPFVHYEISMPKTASLRLKDYKSDSHITGLSADVEVETYKGNVRIDRLDGGLRLETYKGDVRVEMVAVRRDIRLETYKGTIELGVPRSAAFTLDAHSDKGDLDTETFGVNTSDHHRDSRASGNVNGGGSKVRFKTYKGSFRLRAL
jgi:hypothetical protein